MTDAELQIRSLKKRLRKRGRRLAKAKQLGDIMERGALAAVRAWQRVADETEDDQVPGLRERAIAAETIAGLGVDAWREHWRKR